MHDAFSCVAEGCQSVIWGANPWCDCELYFAFQREQTRLRSGKAFGFKSRVEAGEAPELSPGTLPSHLAPRQSAMLCWTQPCYSKGVHSRSSNPQLWAEHSCPARRTEVTVPGSVWTVSC